MNMFNISKSDDRPCFHYYACSLVSSLLCGNQNRSRFDAFLSKSQAHSKLSHQRYLQVTSVDEGRTLAVHGAAEKNQTRSSATAEKQRVSCPHGGRGARPSSPFPPSGYTYAYGRIRNTQQTYMYVKRP